VSRGLAKGTGIGKGHGGNTLNLPLIREMTMTPVLKAGMVPGTHSYKAGKITIFLSRNPVTQAYHLSLAHPDRYPTWDEVAYVRYALIPDDAFMVMALPSQKDYINFHNFCFQMHEIPGDVWNG